MQVYCKFIDCSCLPNLYFSFCGRVIFIQLHVYTEHQKKLITSSEQYSLKSQALKWIIIGHRLAIVLLTKHTSKKKRLIESKKSKMRWNRKKSCFKNHRNCSSPGHRARHGQQPVQRLHTCNPPLKLNE